MPDKALKKLRRSGLRVSRAAEKNLEILRNSDSLEKLEKLTQGHASLYLSEILTGIYEKDKPFEKRTVKAVREKFKDIDLGLVCAYASRRAGTKTELYIELNQGQGRYFPPATEKQSEVFRKIDEFLLSELRKYLSN